MKAKVVLVPVEKVEAGMPVYWDGCPSGVKIWFVHEQQHWNGLVTVVPSEDSPRAQSPMLSELRTVEAEYEVWMMNGTSRKRWAEKKVRPFRIEDWKNAIKLIGQEVDIDESTRPLPNRSPLEDAPVFAILLTEPEPEKGRDSWNEIFKRFMEETNSGGWAFWKPGLPEEWLDNNYYTPIKKRHDKV